MPNLPENYDRKDWEIRLEDDLDPEMRATARKYLQVKHIPTGTASKKVVVDQRVLNERFGSAMIQRWVITLINDTQELIRIKNKQGGPRMPLLTLGKPEVIQMQPPARREPVAEKPKPFPPPPSPPVNNTAHAHKKRKFNLD